MKKGLMKVVALAAASVMAVAALAGCGSSDKLIMGTNQHSHRLNTQHHKVL